jgi:hypothetical protein
MMQGLADAKVTVGDTFSQKHLLTSDILRGHNAQLNTPLQHHDIDLAMELAH